VYTEFLKNQVKISLKNLKDFISKTNDGIKNNPSDEENIGNKAMLMSVMKIISDVKDVDPTIKGVVTRIKDMVMILKKNQESLNDKNEEDPVQVIDNYHNLFNETT
jgi:dynein heavy chain